MGKTLSKFPGYIKTELHLNINETDCYVTLDYWRPKEAYYQFKEQSKQEFLEINKMGEDSTLEEKHIGEFVRII